MPSPLPCGCSDHAVIPGLYVQPVNAGALLPCDLTHNLRAFCRDSALSWPRGEISTPRLTLILGEWETSQFMYMAWTGDARDAGPQWAVTSNVQIRFTDDHHRFEFVVA